jgi:predicted TIM-barrel enzyme
MSVIVAQVASACGPDFLTGVQIMKNAVSASLAVAKAAGAHFIRVSALVGATESPFGVVRGEPERVMAYRKAIGAEDVAILADVHTQHFRAIDGASVGQIAKWAAECGADAVSLGDPDDSVTLALAAEVRAAQPALPILLCGYTNAGNAQRLLAASDGALVGSALQADGWGSAIDPVRVRAYLTAARAEPS